MGKVIVVRATGGPEVLRVEQQTVPEPGEGEVRVAVGAAGVNFIDVYHRTGLYPKPVPFVIGLEGAGKIDAIGPGVASLTVGDRVAWAAVAGSYAERVLAPADKVVPIPREVSDEVAAASMLQGMTAHYLVHGTRETRAGDVVLVHAAAGGVGLLLVQLLKRAGARVIATCSTAEKEKLALGAGAEHVVRYTESDFAARARELTGGRGVDVVYDSVGRTTFDGSLRSLRQRGLLVLFGQSSGPVPPFELGRLAESSLFLTRPTLFHYTADRRELELRAGAVFAAIAAGELEIRIGHRYPLDDAASAHRALESRATAGKVLLTIA